MRVVVTAPLPFGVTDAGAKLQVTPVGSVVLSQLKETAWLEPLMGVTLKVMLPEEPCLIVSAAGFAENV